MLPLYDMMMQAQNGQAARQMAERFGLSEAQARQAMEALMPAFSQGLRRNASDPYGVAGFLEALSSGRHARYFEDAGAAFSPGGMTEGNGILGHIFGSKDLSRAVAAQAAQATGIAETTLKQMLPALAAIVMGGLFKQSSGELKDAGARAPASNPLQDLFEQMMQQGGAGNRRAQEPSATPASPFDNPFGKMLEGMFGQQPTQPQRPNERPGGGANPFSDHPLGRIFEEMMRGAQGAPTAAAPKPQAAPPSNPSGRPRSPYDDLFGEMFDSGRRQRDDYQKSIESIFDRYLDGMKGQR